MEFLLSRGQVQLVILLLDCLLEQFEAASVCHVQVFEEHLIIWLILTFYRVDLWNLRVVNFAFVGDCLRPCRCRRLISHQAVSPPLRRLFQVTVD